MEKEKNEPVYRDSPLRSKIRRLNGFFRPYGKQKEWSHWAFRFKNGKTKLLMGARGYGKTETVLFYAFIRKILVKPRTTAILVTRAQSRGCEILEAMGVILKELGFTGKFTQKSIRLSQNEGAKNPTLKLLGITSTSFKGNHVDYVILDDPLDPSDEDSPAFKRRTVRVYQECLNIAKKGVLIIGQPVSYDDLYQKLRDKVDVLTCFHGEIPKLDVDLEELRHLGVPEREIQKNYFGIILPHKNVPFADVMVGDFNLPQSVSSVYAFLDPSFKGGDTTALAIGYLIRDFMVVVGFTFHASWARSLGLIIPILDDFNVKTLYYEDNGVGDALYIQLRNQGIDHINAIGAQSRGLKINRILSMEGLVMAGHLRLHAKSDDDFIFQFKNYTPLNDKLKDDAPDSVASLLRVARILD